MTIQEATDMVKKLATDNEGKLNATTNFEFDEGIIHLDDTVSPTMITNENLSADCTIKMNLENFEKMMTGNLNPMMAMMMGKLKVDGDKGVAMKLAGLF